MARQHLEFRDSIDDSDAFHCLVCGIRGGAPRPGEQGTQGSPRTTHNLPFALVEVSVKEQDVQTDAVLRWLKGHKRWLLIADSADTDEAPEGVARPLGT
jgi:hypothetical protein